VFDDVDIVYIATPHTLHHQCTILCLKYGKAVLCEKPFAMNKHEVLDMINLAKTNKLFLMEAMWSAFMPAWHKTKQLIAENKIGSIKYISGDFGFKSNFDPQSRLWNKNLGGGALLDIGIYPIFLSLFILGYPNKIDAISHKNEYGVDVSTHLLFQYTDGSIASLQCNLDIDTPTEAYICGTQGYIKMHSRFHETKSLEYGQFLTKESTIESFDRNFRGFTYQVEHVNKCLEEGKIESDVMTWNMSINLVSLLDECREKIGLIY
jgi:predicted dehydrogenase